VARSYQCWDCGKRVSADEVARYEVTRHSTSSGRSFRVNTRRQRVNMCPTCLAKHKRADSIKGIVFLVVIAAAAVYFFVLH
jgi:hypothetical protein